MDFESIKRKYTEREEMIIMEIREVSVYLKGG